MAAIYNPFMFCGPLTVPCTARVESRDGSVSHREPIRRGESCQTALEKEIEKAWSVALCKNCGEQGHLRRIDDDGDTKAETAAGRIVDQLEG
jgi:hypothetical protein